ncbi:MAG: hypothetical protein ACLFM1_08955 [Bacteroidales bacterium]
MIHKFCYTAMAILLSLTGLAQENRDTSPKPYDFKHAIGVNLGETTGKGLAYRFSHEKFSAQLAFWPVVEDFDYDAEIFTSLSFYYRLREYEHGNLLLYQGNEYQYSKQFTWGCPPGMFCLHQPNNGIEEKHLYSTSLGFGFELLLGKRGSINLLMGYTAMDNFTMLKVKGEVGMFFHF